MTPYVLQFPVAVQSAAAASIVSNAFNFTPTNGNAILVALEMEGVGANTFTAALTDTGGNSYTQIGSYVSPDSTRQFAVFISLNITGAASFKVTATPSSTAKMAIGIMELAGVALASAVDVTVSATGTSTSPAAGNTAVSNNNELLISVVTSAAVGTITCTVPTGFSLGPQILTGTSNPVLSMGWALEQAGTFNPAWTIVSAEWACINVSLKSQNFPTLSFNSSTGSDTAASGAGPATALHGVGASVSGTAAVNLSADSPDLSGVATDGSAALWVGTGAGQQFARIIAVDNVTKIVTVQFIYSATASGLNWGIGGARATLAGSANLITKPDARGGWTLSFNDAASLALSAMLTAAAVIGDTTNGPLSIVGVNEGTVFNQSGNTGHFTFGASSLVYFKNLVFTNSNVGTKTNAWVVGVASAAKYMFEQCVIGDITGVNKMGSLAVVGIVATFYLIDVACVNLTVTVVNSGSACSVFLENVWVNNCSSSVRSCFGIVGFTFRAINCLFTNNSANAVLAQGQLSSVFAVSVYIDGCTFDNNVAAFDFLSNSNNLAAGAAMGGGFPDFVVRNCQFTNNGVGIALPAQWLPFMNGNVDYNNFFNNTTNYVNYSGGAHDTTNNPGYINTAGNNWGITAGTGKGFPDATRTIGANQSGTVNYGDQGVAQHKGAGGFFIQ